MLSSLSLLLAVATAVQATARPTPAPSARAHRRAHVATIAPLAAASAELEAGPCSRHDATGPRVRAQRRADGDER